MTEMTVHTTGVSGWFKRTFGRSEMPEDASTASTTTGGDGDSEPVVVWEAANLMEAQVVKGRLESEGIPAIVRGETAGALYGLTTGGLAAVEVLAPAPLADKAIQILNEDVTWDDEPESEETLGTESEDARDPN
jgi:hypothetical protein